jgi:hypothetical protein
VTDDHFLSAASSYTSAAAEAEKRTTNAAGGAILLIMELPLFAGVIRGIPGNAKPLAESFAVARRGHSNPALVVPDEDQVSFDAGAAIVARR